jgi:hypothetical protein
LNRGQKAIAEARNCLHESGVFGVVVQRNSNLSNAEVEALFKSDIRLAPHGLADLLSHYQAPGTFSQQSRDPCRVLLDFDWGAGL